MMILVTYDVNTEDAGGKRRLRRVAKVCMDHGQRVQNSVFECVVDAAQSRELEVKLQALIDPERDSLRLYYMGTIMRQRFTISGCARPMRRRVR